MIASADQPLRIGLVGAGMISRYHLTAWRRCDRACVVAVADPDPDAAANRAREFGIPAVYGDAGSMLDAVDVDAVDIAAPMERHAELCRLAADRGVHIICQKPLCPTLAEANALVAAVDGRVRFMVHENWRFRPAYRRIKEWLDGGRIGMPRAFAMEVMSSGLVPDRPGDRPPALRRQAFFAQMRRLTVLENLIHQLDTLRFLLGGLDVCGARLTRVSEQVVGEDTAMILLEGPGRSIGTLIGCMTVRGLPPRSSDTLRIVGDGGTIEFRDWTLRCSDGDAVETFDPEASYQASFDAVIAHFVDALTSGRSFETSAADNLRTLALVEAVYGAAS